VQSRPARLLCALLPEGHEEGDSPGYFYNHFFEATTDSDSFEQIFLGVSVPKITVSDLPEKGRKAYFSGIVGPCRLRTSVVPTRMTLGQPALFTVHLDDVALGSQVAAVPSVAFGGFRSEFQLSQEPVRQNTTEHSRSFTYVLRPLNRRTTRIPAVVIQTFDPETDTFRTLRSGPIPIAVEGDEEAPLTLTSRIDAQTPAPLHGVRHNQVSECPMITIQNILEFLGRLWWVLVPLPPLLWVALRPTIRRWDRCRHDPVYALALTAWRRFRKTVWHDEEAAWRRYLAERLSLCADALTADSVTESLRRRNVDSNLIAETRDRFEQKDATEYGKRPPTPSKGTRGLARRLQKATTPLLLTSWLLIPLHAIAAESADTLFARAMRMRTEKPDEAHALFVESALSYESTGQFLNAGNSWFFAGENGRALGNYRAAQRRTPFDGQVRESIEFLRANRVDAFPSENTPEGRVAAVWNRYGTWRPSLRVGAFVVTYLAAWTLFLTAQLAGWRVRRSLWGVLLTAAMLPLASLIHSSFRQPEGVVIEDSVARLGPGYAYDPAFKQPIHKATEFAWLETREGWVHVRLPDTSEGWLLRSGCMLVE